MENRNTKNWSYKVSVVISVPIETDIGDMQQTDVHMSWTALLTCYDVYFVTDAEPEMGHSFRVILRS